MTVLDFTVRGVPGAQGSKTVYGAGRFEESSKKVAPWRQDVKAAAEAALKDSDWPTPHGGPVNVLIVFAFTRPRSHYRTGRHANELRANTPTYVTSRGAGDLDKLLRSSADALVAAGIIADDSLIVHVTARKVYTDGVGGARVRVTQEAP